MDFSYIPAGPNAGFCFTKDGISVRITFIAKTESTTIADYDALASRIIQLHNALGIIEEVDLSSPSGEIGIEQRPLSARSSCAGFTKYTTKETYDQHISKGSFRIGSIVDYKTTEALHAKDPQEGFCNIAFRNRDENIFATVFGGENLRLFCGSANENSEYLMKKFGTVRMVLRDIDGFGNAIAEHLAAKSWKFGGVTYANRKVYVSNFTMNISLEPENLAKNPDSMRQIFDFVANQCAPGTVYLKPLSYQPEEESRFVFEMSRDLTAPNLNIVDLRLLDFFEIFGD